LAEAGIASEEVTIDTVERYQGGARDIIIVSSCVHSKHQLRSLVNLSEDGIDRKLNVALTRARQYLVVLGKEEVLREDERYRLFIDRYKFRQQ
jgi:DNA replication ATP-dependent helicase Dna2